MIDNEEYDGVLTKMNEEERRIWKCNTEKEEGLIEKTGEHTRRKNE